MPASAKLVNVATNAASLFYFATTGQVLYKVALPMAACNMLGSTFGARMAQQVSDRVLRWGIVAYGVAAAIWLFLR